MNLLPRTFLLLAVLTGQAAGFLTLTPPDEAFDNLAKWWEFAVSLIRG